MFNSGETGARRPDTDQTNRAWRPEEGGPIWPSSVPPRAIQGRSWGRQPAGVADLGPGVADRGH